MNNITENSLSVVCKFLDTKSFKNLHKTNKFNKETLEKKEFQRIYKKNVLLQFIGNKNLFNLVEKNSMINQLYKNNNSDKYMNIILLYIEKYFDNDVETVNTIDIYDFTFFFDNHNLTRYDTYNFLVSRNILIKKFLSRTNDKFKVVFILYLTRFFVATFLDVNWFCSDFYKFENKHWESTHNQFLRDYLTDQ
jgi:hypothetical protein